MGEQVALQALPALLEAASPGGPLDLFSVTAVRPGLLRSLRLHLISNSPVLLRRCPLSSSISSSCFDLLPQPPLVFECGSGFSSSLYE